MRAGRALSVVCALLFCSAAGSAQALWTGLASTSWNNPSNWSTGAVPGPTDATNGPAI